jgi:outer membrane protein TolC
LRTLSPIFLLFVAASVSAQEPISVQQALDRARANRPAFEAARLRIVQAQSSRRAAGAFPATRLLVGYTTDPDVGGSDEDLVLSQPIDVFGRTGAARRAGSAAVAQAEAAFRQVSADVQAEVLEAYLAAAESAELVRSAQSVLDIYQRLHEATRLRVEGGVAPGFHLTQVGLDLEQSRLRTEQRQSEARANLQRLAYLVGSAELAAIQPGFPDLVTPEVDEATLVRQRADLSLLAAEVQAAEAETGLARLGALPELEIQGRRTPWQERNEQYGVRVQLSIPLFDYDRSRAEVKAASTRADAARKALSDATRLALGEVKATRIEVDAAQTQVSKYEALVAQARRLVEQLRPGLTEQATTLIEVLDASRVLRDVEQSLVESRARLALAQARYVRAAGITLEVPN